ncbi:MAG: 2-polyprenylphenol 6-hydroxylase [Neomegalonema sp.]|nr:2-polyprenylphenol 6-hydroxylase [Neomegalonema sp.]
MIGRIARLVRVAATLRRTRALGPVLDVMEIHGWRRGLVYAVTTPVWIFGKSGDPSLPPVSRAASALGPSYVKFGQVLSTRPDVAGKALAADLRRLQDKLPPFDNAAARREIAAQLGAPLERFFLRLDPPVAAASIAQVHPAVTKTGEKVAVKVLRPGVERAFARDIQAFYFIAGFLETFRRKSRRLKPRTVVQHFEGVVTREMDLRLEAAAGSEYGENTKGEAGFRTPEIHWHLTAKRVLTTSWIEGPGLGDVAALEARDVDLPAMALRLVRLFLRTALRDGYFHADMHQGNLKLASDGAVVAFDFGIMGRIDATTRRTYAEILYSYLTRDYRRGARAHFDAGYVDRSHNLDHFAQALRSIGEPIVGQRADEISMARVLQQLFDVTEQFGMETRPELILLQRTMVVVEGVARSLDPNFDMWEAARPEVERWMRENLGPRGVGKRLYETADTLRRVGPRLPELAETLVEVLEDWSERRKAPPPTPPRSRFWLGALCGVALAALLLGGGLAIGVALKGGLAAPATSTATDQ